MMHLPLFPHPGHRRCSPRGDLGHLRSWNIPRTNPLPFLGGGKDRASCPLGHGAQPQPQPQPPLELRLSPLAGSCSPEPPGEGEDGSQAGRAEGSALPGTNTMVLPAAGGGAEAAAGRSRAAAGRAGELQGLAVRQHLGQVPASPAALHNAPLREREAGARSWARLVPSAPRPPPLRETARPPPQAGGREEQVFPAGPRANCSWRTRVQRPAKCCLPPAEPLLIGSGCSRGPRLHVWPWHVESSGSNESCLGTSPTGDAHFQAVTFELVASFFVQLDSPYCPNDFARGVAPNLFTAIHREMVWLLLCTAASLHLLCDSPMNGAIYFACVARVNLLQDSLMNGVIITLQLGQSKFTMGFTMNGVISTLHVWLH